MAAAMTQRRAVCGSPNMTHARREDSKQPPLGGHAGCHAQERRETGSPGRRARTLGFRFSSPTRSHASTTKHDLDAIAAEIERRTARRLSTRHHRPLNPVPSRVHIHKMLRHASGRAMRSAQCSASLRAHVSAADAAVALEVAHTHESPAAHAGTHSRQPRWLEQLGVVRNDWT